MTTAYFSTVLDVDAESVWLTIRQFDNYEWAGVGYGATMEDGLSGTCVGGVRRVGADESMRQQLVEMSDVDRHLTYDVLPGSSIDVANYRATLRIIPVTDTGQAFVEWSATFDCSPEDADTWQRFYAEDRFPAWLGALRRHLAG